MADSRTAGSRKGSLPAPVSLDNVKAMGPAPRGEVATDAEPRARDGPARPGEFRPITRWPLGRVQLKVQHVTWGGELKLPTPASFIPHSLKLAPGCLHSA